MKVNFGRIIIPPEREWSLNLITNLLQCKICMNILNNPYDCLCCNQTFCKNCITNYINTNKKCPYSNFFKNKIENKSNTSTDLITIKPTCSNIVKVLSSLKFLCAFHSKGCDLELNIEDLTEHEKVCKFKSINKKGTNLFANHPKLNKKREKYAFQDSCMSFRKVDICPSENSNISISNFNTDFPNSNEKMTIEKIAIEINKLSEKISNIECLIQTSNSVQSQNYLIQNSPKKREVDCFSSPSLKRIITPMNRYFIRKEFSEQVFKNNLQFTTNSKNNKRRSWANKKKFIIPSQSPKKREKSEKEKEKENEAKEFEKILDKKFKMFKENINENFSKEIKNYLLELTLDSNNLFIQKIDEVMEIVSKINEVNSNCRNKIEKENKGNKKEDITEIVAKTVERVKTATNDNHL